MENGTIKKNGELFASSLLRILAAASGAACGLCGMMTLCIFQMYVTEAGDIKPHFYDRFLMRSLDVSTQGSFVNNGTLLTAALGVAFFVLLLVLCVRTGRYHKNADGSIALIWVDRIWTEIQIVLIVAFAVGAFACCIPMTYILPSYPYLSFYEPYILSPAIFGPDNEYVALLCIAGMFICVYCTVGLFVSVVKKLKARMFWEYSAVGGFVLWVSRRYRNSENTTVKVTLLLCAAALLCGTWIGIPLVIVLILWKVPQLTKRFNELRRGVDEVRSGNLEYKIPVYPDRKGVKGDFDRLAEGINDISSASNIAVQNEIKNQRTKTELISNVSHDLKTPMTSIISYVDLLKKEGLDSENAPEYLRILDEKTARLKSLTEDLFEAAKASSGDIPCEIRDIDLAALADQAFGEMEEKLKAKNLELIVKNTAQSPMVKADGQLLWRVIENLLSNVSKYALEGSRVYVNICDAGKSNLMLEVKNISRDQLNISADELMERFKRGDESRATEGSGLGLAIAKDLTGIMNGVFEITVDGDLFKAAVMLPKA